MTFNFLGPGLTVNVEAKVKEQIILDSSEIFSNNYRCKNTGYLTVQFQVLSKRDFESIFQHDFESG